LIGRVLWGLGAGLLVLGVYLAMGTGLWAAGPAALAVGAAVVAWMASRASREEALRTEARVRTVLGEAAGGCLWTVGPDDRAWYSDAWTRTFGMVAGEQQLQVWLDRVHADDLGALTKTLGQVREGVLPSVRRTYRMNTERGERWFELFVTRIPAGGSVELAGSVEDVTERHEAHERLARTAMHDTLTGLPNRALLLDRLGHATSRARRDPRYRFAVLFLDLDDFKVVNDSLGHEAGDLLLQAVAERLRASVRPGDTVARMGGDEFTVLLESVNGMEGATNVSARIARELDGGVDIRGHLVQLSASIGIVVSEPRHTDPMELLRDADAAMYQAKRAGSGQQRVFDQGMRESTRRRLQIESELQRALRDGGLQVHYQPIVNLSTGRIEGFEALCRMETSAGAMVSPVEFIPLAETLGLIDDVMERVLACATAQLGIWRALDPKLYVSINVSAQSLTTGLVERFVAALGAHGLSPDSLRAELTESGLVDSAAASEAVVRLRELGVGLYIDDFGTGYSSLAHLHELPVDRIKLDRTFVASLDGQQMPDVVETIVALSERLGAGVIAEGVETRSQLEALAGLDCRAGQGFLFAPAQPAEVATQLLREGRAWPPLHATASTQASPGAV